MIRGRHVIFEPGDVVSPVDLYRIEGPQQAITFPAGDQRWGSAHLPMNLVDTHPGLLRAMCDAAYTEWMTDGTPDA